MKLIEIKGLSQADPYIVKTRGKYFIYCTGDNGVHCYKSENLFTGWEYVGIVLSVDGQKGYWAPSVIERNGKYYMYYSSVPESESDVHAENIKAAVSDEPDGGFVFVKDLLPPFSIDPHVVENETGLYIFYSINDYVAEKAGTYIVADKMLDEFTVSGNPKTIVKPTLEEEIFEKDRFRKGQDWYTLEGAFYFKKDGVHYCIYSANCYMKPDYHLGYAYCRSDRGELNTLDFKKYSPDRYSPLLCSDDTEISTGHCSMIEESGELYLVYHGREINSNCSANDRTARICRLNVKDEKLETQR